MSAPPVRSSWLATASVGAETVIYDPVRDGFHVLNRTATAIWELIDGARNEAQIGHELGQRYAVASAAADVRNLTARLRSAGLVEAQDGRAAGLHARPHPGDAVTAQSARRLPRAETSGRSDVVFRALDYAFTVDGDDQNVVRATRHVLRDLRSTTGVRAASYWMRTAADTVLIEVDGVVVTIPAVPERAIHLLLWHINQAAVRHAVGRKVILHAAAVERDGTVVLLPAAMERGKTTTAAGLIRAGYRYLSDELAAIDPRTLFVRPYPKPLGIDPGAQRVLADLGPAGVERTELPWQIPATAIHPDALGRAGRPAVIIAPEYDPNAVTRLVPVAPSHMVVRLADCTFGFKEHPQRDLDVLARVVRTSACYQLPISSLDTAVALVDSAVTAAMRSLPHSMSGLGT